MKKLALVLAVSAAALLTPSVINASTIFVANLNGASEVPANASPAFGFGTVVLNDTEDQITVDLSWTGLTAPADAAHIHDPGAAGTNAPVLFPFSSVPAVTSGSMPEQFFAITPTQVGQLQAGLFYMDVHTTNFPGGEIRGQLQLAAPEPGSMALMGFGLATLLGLVSRRRRE
jgi:hypothetical protein